MIDVRNAFIGYMTYAQALQKSVHLAEEGHCLVCGVMLVHDKTAVSESLMRVERVAFAIGRQQRM